MRFSVILMLTRQTCLLRSGSGPLSLICMIRKTHGLPEFTMAQTPPTPVMPEYPPAWYMERSKPGQLFCIGIRHAYHRYPAPAHSQAPTDPPQSTWASVTRENLVGPTAALTPITVATPVPPLSISSILKKRTIQTAPLIHRPLILPTILTRRSLIS